MLTSDLFLKIESLTKRALKNSTGKLVKKKKATMLFAEEEVTGLNYTKKLTLALARLLNPSRSCFQEHQEEQISFNNQLYIIININVLRGLKQAI